MSTEKTTQPADGLNPDQTGNIGTAEQQDVNQIERADTNNDGVFEKKAPTMDKVDEFGAHAKTDPKEIALVRKLDMHILVWT